MNIGPYSLPSQVLLAPMAGTSDKPFRMICKAQGAGLTTSEMVVMQNHLLNSNKSKHRLDFTSEQSPISIQIAGSEAEELAESAKKALDFGADIIDINMGCPAKKVVNGYAGSALMQDIKAAKEIIEHVVNAVKVPVTLKTRLGWDDKKLNAPELCLIAQDLGIQLITLHGRTRCQFFKGTADWERISDTVNELQIPVIANGDITDVNSARRALKLSGAAGIMIGRGVGGKPWLLAEISHVLFNTKPPKIPSAQSFCEMMVLHYEAVLTFYGDTSGVRSVRKHINWYLGYMGITDGKIRKKILTEENPSLVINMIKALIDLER